MFEGVTIALLFLPSTWDRLAVQGNRLPQDSACFRRLGEGRHECRNFLFVD